MTDKLKVEIENSAKNVIDIDDSEEVVDTSPIDSELDEVEQQ